MEDPKICLICFSSIEKNVYVPAISNYVKMLENCFTHLHSALTNHEKFKEDRTFSAEHEFQFCKKCFESADELTRLTEQLSTVQQEILDLAVTFSMAAFYRRTNFNCDAPKIELDVSGLPAHLFLQSTPNSPIGEDMPFTEDEEEMQFKVDDEEIPFIEDEEEENAFILKTSELEDSNHLIEEFEHEIVKCENINDSDVSFSDSIEDYPLEETENQHELVLKIEVDDGHFENNTQYTTSNPPQKTKILLTDNTVETETTGGSRRESTPINMMPKIILKRLDTGTTKKHSSSSSSGSSIKIESKSPTPGAEVQNVVLSDELKTKMNEANCFSCSLCGKIVSSQRNLERHLQTHSGEQPFKCSICEKRFSRKYNAIIHERCHSGAAGKIHKCNFCTKTFVTSSQKVTHQRTHTGEKPYKCKFCTKTFRFSNCRLLHERIHMGEKKHQCERCGRQFLTKTRLTSHQQRARCPKPPVYKPLKFRKPVAGGKREKHTDSNIKCTFCDKTFGVLSAKIEHERRHTGEKPFKCSFCDQTFAQRSGRTIHERLHTGEKPYKCNYCEMTFRNAGHRGQHHRSHTGEKPYKCSYCEMCFKESVGKVKHQLTHLRKTHCPKKLKSEKRHRRTHLRETHCRKKLTSEKV